MTTFNAERRVFIKKSALLLAGSSLIGVNSLTACAAPMAKSIVTRSGDEFTLPKLPYSYDALEPFIDKMTMEIHYSRHHQAYITNLNKALGGFADSKGKTLEEICGMVSKMNDAVRNNAGGHYNHSLFWSLMKPAPATMPKGDLADAINASFGSVDKLKEAFTDAGMKRFGSGWAWVVLNKDKKLEIISTPNQDNPLMDIAAVKGKPVLALDVWEHAYYLKYQNKRKDYIDAWWNLVNWEKAGELLK